MSRYFTQRDFPLSLLVYKPIKAKKSPYRIPCVIQFNAGVFKNGRFIPTGLLSYDTKSFKNRFKKLEKEELGLLLLQSLDK